MQPLLVAYDNHFFNVEKELRQARSDVERLAEMNKQLQTENESLSERLEVKIREYAELVSKTLKHSEILSNFQDEKQEQEDRLHLLTEENHTLLEQVAMLRGHFDHFNKIYDERVTKADKMIAEYSKVKNGYDEMSRNVAFLERKLAEQT